MTPARLTPANTALLLVDVQGKLAGQMHHAKRLIERCCYIMQAADLLELPIAITEQYVKGLGHTVEPILAVTPDRAERFEKTRFGGCTEPVCSWLGEHGRSNILLAGIEAHICVLQTGLELLENGQRPFWLSDAISAGQADQIDHARRRIERLGGFTTGCMSAVYELLADAKHPQFAAVLQLTKALGSA